MSRDDCSSSTVSVFNNNTDQAEFYEHQTNKAEHRERVPAAAGSEYYEKAKSKGEYYEQRKEQHGSEYYAPLRLPVNCSTPEVELRTTSHSVTAQDENANEDERATLDNQFHCQCQSFYKLQSIQVGTTWNSELCNSIKLRQNET